MHTAEKGIDALALAPKSVHLTPREKLRFKALADVGAAQIHFRFALLKIFNRYVSESLELIDLTAGTGWSLGSRLRALGACIFHDTKRRLLHAAIENTATPPNDGLSVTLNNNNVWDSLDRSLTTPSTSRCLFVQAFERLNKVSDARLRAALDTRDRLFEVKFAAEEGLDWGGLYRDAILRMTDELFAGRNIDLFQPTPNGRHSSGLNADKFVPNPIRTSPLALEMCVASQRLALRSCSFSPHRFFFARARALDWSAVAAFARRSAARTPLRFKSLTRHALRLLLRLRFRSRPAPSRQVRLCR